MPAKALPSALEAAASILRGDERALARLITGLEDGDPAAAGTLRALRGGSAAVGQLTAQVVGVTGPPGSGKSTLVDKLISAYRAKGLRVGVLAVDPSSPFSGGAILGDRIRMQRAEAGPGGGLDPGVFIRSLASRGRLGGLSRATAQSARALEAAGYGVVIVETVGIGQSEIDIARLADTVVLVSMPGSGDDIQVIKAGVMEIGDVFVVNKADREGSDRVVREIRAMLETGATLRQDLALRQGGAAELQPVLKTVAETGEGLPELVLALDARWAKLNASGELASRRARGAAAEARSLLAERALAELALLEPGLEEGLAMEIVRGEREVAEAAEILFSAIRK